jgi:hypothetical protein
MYQVRRLLLLGGGRKKKTRSFCWVLRGKAGKMQGRISPLRLINTSRQNYFYLQFPRAELIIFLDWINQLGTEKTG